MVFCQVRTGVRPIVKANALNERVYKLSYARQGIQFPDLKCYVKFKTPPSYIGILVILMYYITFLSEVKCL